MADTHRRALITASLSKDDRTAAERLAADTSNAPVKPVAREFTSRWQASSCHLG